MLARITINLILMGLFCSLALAEQPTGWKWSKIETTANTSIIMDHKIEFFSVGEDIHIILWNHIDSNTTAANSTLARFKSLDHKWNTIPITGKAHYLGDPYTDEILSIVQKNEKWYLRFYDLTGSLLREVVHSYQKMPREHYHLVPFPFAMHDGTVLLYSMYLYETRNPVIGFFLSFVSGGHGWKPRYGKKLEVIPELVARIPDESGYVYTSIIDAQFRRQIVLGDIGLLLPDQKAQRIVRNNVNKRDVIEYELSDRNNLYYCHLAYLFQVSDKVQIFNAFGTLVDSMPLPDFPAPLEQKELFANSSNSDLIMDDKGNLFFTVHAFKAPTYTFVYDRRTNRWHDKIVIADLKSYQNHRFKYYHYFNKT